jgi:hypothetical protein
LEDVHKKVQWEADFEHSSQRFHMLADLWVSTYFGNSIAWDEYNTIIEHLQDSNTEWAKLTDKKYVRNALILSAEKRFFHWELEFPEVFYDEKGNRKANPGFDVVVGNPPYGAAFDESEKGWLRDFFITGCGLTDSYALFIEYSLRLMRKFGYSSMIIPNSLLTIDQFADFRNHIISNFKIIQIVNLVETVFKEVRISVMIPIFFKDNGWQKRAGKQSISITSLILTNASLAIPILLKRLYRSQLF